MVVGVVILVVGINASHSAADQLSNTFKGRYTDATMWYIVGGIGAAIVGLLLTVFGASGSGKSV